MTEHKFRVIKGGAAVAVSKNRRKFLSAFITDTRLMGVVGLYIHWELYEKDYRSDFHQFFYFDAEEYGFENYKSLIGDDAEAILTMEQALIGGLGGSKVNVSEREALFMVQQYVEMNKRLSLELPEGKNEYGFMLSNPVVLSHDENQQLINKLCTPMLSEYQLINYFLMRSFAKDFEAASYLSSPGLVYDEIPEIAGATLCKNSIEEYYEGENFSYLCESLIEIDGKYKLVISELTLEDVKVSSAKMRSSFYITPAEAAMMLNHAEFITVYEIVSNPDDFTERFASLSGNFMQTGHENGTLYLEFNVNNDHVNQKIFRLNEDIRGLYYLTFYGQLIVAAYGAKSIQKIEKELESSGLCDCIVPTSKYEFKEPILYEFIQSDFDDFSDFLDFLNS